MTTATATKPAAKNNDAATKPTGPSEAIKTLASIYETGITVAKDGTPQIADDLIENNLPDDMPLATLKRSQKVRGEVVAALGLALSNKGLPVLAKNKELDKVAASFKFGGDKIDLAIEREREFNDGKGGKLKKQGYLSVGYTATGSTNAGEFKKVREYISSEAATLFG